tara:strand:+ start:987 stop:1163 length:177 start_codon:yes stop_codon:yes gene_type:complete
MKNITITFTDSDGAVTFETSTPQIAKEISEVDRCTLEQLHAEDVVDFLKDELNGRFYN